MKMTDFGCWVTTAIKHDLVQTETDYFMIYWHRECPENHFILSYYFDGVRVSRKEWLHCKKHNNFAVYWSDF